VQETRPAPLRAAPYGRRLSGALRLLLPAALALPLLVLGGGAWLAWRDAWTSSERELARGADAVAEYALRLIDGFRLSIDLADHLLRDLPDAEIAAREDDLREQLRGLLPDLPGMVGLIVLDRERRVILDSTGPSATRTRRLDAYDFLVALRSPDAPLQLGAVAVSRLSGRMVFAVAKRRSAGAAPPAAIDGIISVGVDPNDFAAGFATIGGEAGDVSALVRADGAVLARSNGFAVPPPPIPADSPLHAAAAAGVTRGRYIGRSLAPERQAETRLIAFRQVGTLPVYATVARPRPLIVAAWQRAVVLQCAIGVPAWLALSLMAWLAAQRARRADEAEAALREETARRAAAEAAAAAEARFRAVFDSAVTGKAVFDIGTGEVVEVNGRLLELTGATRDASANVWDWRRITPPEFNERDEAAIAQARERGWWEPYEKEYQRADGTRVPVRVSSAPMPGEPGRVVVMVQDISEQRAAEQRRDLLKREVDHRAKNALAVVQSALRLTPRTDAEAYARAVEGRVAALARAHTLLSEAQWEGATLEALVRAELAPFVAPAGPRVTIAGPDILLLPAAVQALSMALHELATNAVKHGALGMAEGHLAVTWSVEEAADRLRLRWEERGGPRVTAPAGRRGFGTRVIAATLRQQLGGTVAHAWEPEGLAVAVELPLRRIRAAAEGNPSAAAPA
jgi:PAS domain S-box-containing protein